MIEITDTAVVAPADSTPDYDSFHALFDEVVASNALADQLDVFGKTEIDFEVPEAAGESFYPTVAQIETDLGAYPAQADPTVESIQAELRAQLVQTTGTETEPELISAP